MFLRRHTKHIGQEDDTYGSLVKTVRTAKGLHHEWVAHWGTLSPTEAQQVHGWSDLDSLLEGKTPVQQLTLRAAAPPPSPAPLWRTLEP